MGEMENAFLHGKIKETREARGMSQAELAALIGATGQQLNQWEVGEVEPRLCTLLKIVTVTDTPLRYFFVLTGNAGK